MGKAIWCAALSRAGASDLRSLRPRACMQTLCTETGRSQERPIANPQSVRSGKVSGHNARHARDWEVGRGNSIDEANEQRYATKMTWPTTGGVRGEKAPGRGEHWTGDRDRHAGAGRSVERLVQGTRSSTFLRLT